jgi:hypothetical protein
MLKALWRVSTFILNVRVTPETGCRRFAELLGPVWRHTRLQAVDGIADARP